MRISIFLFMSILILPGCKDFPTNNSVHEENSLIKGGMENISSNENNVDIDTISISDIVNHANFIFMGKLQDVQYKASNDGIPYTFATYRVGKILKGSYTSDIFMLRFIGGYKDNMTTHLYVSNAPELQVNEEAFLMIDSNENSLCALVTCNKGHMRIVDGYVLNAAGSRISVDHKGRLTQNSGLGKYHVKADSFAKRIRKLAEQGLKTGQSKKIRTVKSASIREDFSGPVFSAAPPPENSLTKELSSNNRNKKSKHYKHDHISDYDNLEIDQLRRNNGNPVLIKTYDDSGQ